MARLRRTLALILICLPILATVITAFRIRDLPKNNEDSTKPEKQKCNNCDVKLKVVPKVQSIKIESVRHVNIDKPKTSYKFVDDSADDDDDNDLDFFKSVTGFKQEENSKGVKLKQDVPKTKSDVVNHIVVDKKFATVKTSDDADNADEPASKKTTKIIDVKKNIDSGTKQTIKGSVITKQSTPLKHNKDDVNDDDDDDDDNDDGDDDDDDDDGGDEKAVKKPKEVAHKRIDSETKKNSKGVKETKKSKLLSKVDSKVDDDDEDDDDEDDDDDDDDDDDEDEDHDDDTFKIPEKKTLSRTHKSASEKSPKIKEVTDSKKESSKKTVITDVLKDNVKNKEKKLEPKQKLDTKQELANKFNDKKESKTSASKSGVDEPGKKAVEPAKEKTEVKKEPKEPKIKEDLLHKELEKKPEKEQPKEIKTKHHEEPNRPEKKPLIDSKKEKSKSIETKKIELLKSDKSSTEILVDSKEFLSKSGSPIQQVTEALERKNLLQSEFEDYYAFFPTFAPNFSRIHNSECRRHGQILLRQLRGTKLWALNMLDATAKIPSGILQGNGIQLGDFDQCLGSRARVQLDTGSVVKVQGKYCLARVDVKAEHPELEVPVHLAQAKNLIKSRIDDPGHFVPRFSTLSWGVCVPSPCNHEDVEVVIKDAVKHYQHRSGVAVRVKVDEHDCHTQDGADWWEDWLELPTILTLSFYAVVVLLVLVATVQDYVARRKPDESQDADESNEKAECDQKETEDEKEKEVETAKKADGFLGAFSLYHTIDKLLAPGTDDEISCIHGIRAIATLALLVAHKFLPVAAKPYINRLKITETVSSPLWSWCRAGWMYTDCFLLLSGALTAHRMSADSDTGAPRRLLSRYLRLTPALLAVVLFYAFVWDNVSSGPMWGALVTKNAQVCQEGWWWNLLYLQNYFGFEEMCAPQTHQLALDMQLTILGGILVWAMQSKRGLSWVLLPSIHVIAAYSRYTTVRDHRLTLLAYHGVSVSQLYRTARLSYTSTLHRCTPYLIGISLGLALQKPSKHSKILLALGWLVGLTLWSAVWWAGLDSGSTTYRYSTNFAAQYSAFAPIASAAAIAWVIYAVHNGGPGLMCQFLCCRPLVLISRLSYALYLCQFIVFLTNAATVRTSSEFTITSLIDVQEISAIMLTSIILTLTFVIPMQSLHKVFNFSSNKENPEDTKDTEEENKSDQSERLTENNKEPQSERVIEEIEVPQIRSRQHFLAHREFLEEIPETEVEYEMQREKCEGLEEILEEEEDEADEEMQDHLDNDDLEIIEEEQGGEDDFWADREENTPRRSYARDEDQDVDEWEWTANGSERNGAQYFRYAR